MKDYELLIALKPHMDTEEVSKVVEKIEAQITALEGKINNTDKIGRKKLSYEIQKFRDGFFVIEKISLEPSKVSELKRQLKLNDNLLRYMFLTADKVNA